MTRTPAIRGCVPLRVTFVDGFVSSHTSTGLLLVRAYIICAGEYMSHRHQVLRSTTLPRESHQCSALCSAPGICQIDAAPMSIEATFTGRHETFQYTKVKQQLRHWLTRLVSDPAVRLSCLLVHTRFDLNHSQVECKGPH
jgi:hypothetical protein